MRHFLNDTFESAKEPIVVRFTDGPRTFIQPFSVCYILGFSRALTALLLLEMMCRMAFELQELQELVPLISSLQYVWCVYDPATDAIKEVENSILAKMRGSERQRPDLLQLAQAFSLAADLKVSQGKKSTREETLNAVMAEYNKKQAVANCRLEGDERTGVKFLVLSAPDVCRYLREVWNEFRVRESPITVHMLAASYLVHPTGGTKSNNEHVQCLAK